MNEQKEALAAWAVRAWQDHSPALAWLSLVGLLPSKNRLRFARHEEFSMFQGRAPETGPEP
jgi:hypothetical protein